MLTVSDFSKAAKDLKVPVAAIRAVCEVEAPRGGFLPTGEPTILFERHIFSRLTNRRYDARHPDISNKSPGGYGPASAQHARLQKAVQLDKPAALKSASWGRFQILGLNHVQAGFTSLQDFINAMYRSEQSQLEAFVDFIKNDKRLLNALQTLNWTAFARIYNGPAYRINRYDTRLQLAYDRYA